MQLSAGKIESLSNSLQAELLRYSVFSQTRYVQGHKPRVVASGERGAVMIRLDQVMRPLSEVALNAAIRFVRRRMWV